MFSIRRVTQSTIVLLLIVIMMPVSFANHIVWDSQVLERPDGSVIYNKIKEGNSYESPTWGRNSSEVLFTLSKGGYEFEYSNLAFLDTKNSNVITLTDDNNRRLETANGQLYYDHSIFFEEKSNGVSLLRKLELTLNEFTLESEWSEVLEFPRWVDVANPSLSADGEWLAFDGASDEVLIDGKDVRQIYKMNKRSGEIIQLTTGSQQKRRPRWSSDGYLLLYEQYDSQFREWSIYITDASGKHHRRLSPGMGNETYGSFSPDGNWVVYSADEDIEGEALEKNKLFIQSVYSGEILQLTRDRFYDTRPSWSPDGERIVFQTSPKAPESYGMSWIAIIEVPEI